MKKTDQRDFVSRLEELFTSDHFFAGPGRVHEDPRDDGGEQAPQAQQERVLHAGEPQQAGRQENPRKFLYLPQIAQ